MLESEILEFAYVLMLSILSFARVIIACMISVVSAIILSYAALSSRKNERLILGILDVLQSIPVLSFIPGVMIFLSRFGALGVELSAIILIVTGTIWNIIFSYYSSLKSIPSHISDLAQALKFGPAKRFLMIDFPFSVPQLTWNLILSFGGGWYFITYCEIFAIGELKYRVLGVGSYISESSASGDIFKIVVGLVAIVLVITLSFVFVWFPLVRFSRRFRFEETSAGEVIEPMFIGERGLSDLFDAGYKKALNASDKIDRLISRVPSFASELVLLAIVLSLVVVLSLIFYEMRKVSVREVTDVLLSLFPSIFRVVIGVSLSASVAIPLGIIFGLNKKYYGKVQPLVQILSSLPAPAFVPILYQIFKDIEGGVFLSSLVIIFLSSFWYIFYNTVGGVFSIPSDAFEVAKAMRMSRYDTLRNIILPGASKDIFVGLLTAWGGAWNGTFVAEYLHVGDEEFHLYGIGSFISRSATEGNIPVLLFATVVLATFVFLTNILIWQRLIRRSARRIR